MHISLKPGQINHNYADSATDKEVNVAWNKFLMKIVIGLSVVLLYLYQNLSEKM